MKKLLATAAVAVLLLAVQGITSNFSIQAQEPKTTWRSDECRFGGLQPRAWTVKEIRSTIACAQERWPVPGRTPKALAVARCESGPDLKDPGHDAYLGTFQHSARYWPARYRNLAPDWSKALSPDGVNPRSNVVIAIRLAHIGGWGPWSCA